MTISEDHSNPPQRSPWPLVIALAIVLLVVAFSLTLPEASDAPAAGPFASGDPREGVITLRQKRPDAEPLEAEVAATPKMTVEQATRLAGRDDPAWASEWGGSGEMALLESLGSEASQGGDGLNWQFEVNGVYAVRGAGAYQLEPGDHVLWRLAPYE